MPATPLVVMLCEDSLGFCLRQNEDIRVSGLVLKLIEVNIGNLLAGVVGVDPAVCV